MHSHSKEKLSIAVVDDDPVFRELACAMVSLRPEYEPIAFASGDELFGKLEGLQVACILLDYDLGTETGFVIKKKLDLVCSNPPPVIMLTGDGRERTAIEAFRMGVNDYLPKLAMDPDTLTAMISSVITNEQVRLRTRAEHNRLEQAASIDPITGLFGQAHLSARLAQLAQLSQDDQRAYAVVSAELVQYHSIVDHFGAGVAEYALKAFAEKLKGIRQADDLCGRYCDGTFIVIKRYRADPAAVDDLCRRLSDFLSFTIDTPFAKLTLSAKVTITAGGSELSTEFDQWTRLAEPAATMLRSVERGSPAWVGTLDHGSTGVASLGMSDALRQNRPHLPAWVYAPLQERVA